MGAWGSKNDYMETQYYGHRTIADVEEMIFYGESNFTKVNEEICNKHGIKYKVLNSSGTVVKQGNY
jgi:hypothetical protein